MEASCAPAVLTSQLTRVHCSRPGFYTLFPAFPKTWSRPQTGCERCARMGCSFSSFCENSFIGNADPVTLSRLSFPTEPGGSFMPKYVIEREIPGAGDLTPEQLKGISQTSCNVLRKLGPEIQWIESYVTGDKIYCLYFAPNEQIIREHASQGGFPANRISQVKSIIDPTTS